MHDGISGKLLAGLRDHSLDVVVARAGPALDVEGIVFEPLYVQQPRLIASRRLAARLARRALDWSALAELDWILGVPQTAMRDQVASLFMQAGIRPPAATTECHSAKLIGELIAASDRALSIVPADIADELVSVAGVAIVPFSFTWHLPPIAVFMRHESQGSAPTGCSPRPCAKSAGTPGPAEQGVSWSARIGDTLGDGRPCPRVPSAGKALHESSNKGNAF